MAIIRLYSNGVAHAYAYEIELGNGPLPQVVSPYRDVMRVFVHVEGDCYHEAEYALCHMVVAYPGRRVAWYQFSDSEAA